MSVRAQLENTDTINLLYRDNEQQSFLREVQDSALCYNLLDAMNR